jgi:hypothetical protein
MKKITLAIALFIVNAMLFADGTVTTQNPVAEWKITDLRFARVQDPETKMIVITVGYFRADGSQDHAADHIITGTDYYAMLDAQRTASGPDEADLILQNGQPDLSAINILRISRWMISTGRLSGVTAEPTPTQQ